MKVRVPFSPHGPIMLPGDFSRLIVALNPRLRIITGESNRDKMVASVYHWDSVYNPDRNCEFRNEGNWMFVTRVPINWLPERTIKNAQGKILDRGWRDALNNIAQLGYIRIPKILGGNNGILKEGRVQVIGR